MKIYRDYETMSAVDLAKAGAVKYAQHPSTDVYCMAVKVVTKGPCFTVIWLNPRFEELLPAGHGLPLISTDRLRSLLRREHTTESHNDGFEQAIDRYIMEPRFNMPHIPLERRSCSAAQAAMNVLPRDLDELSKQLGGPLKNKAGHDLMLKMCKPRSFSKAIWKELDAYAGYPPYEKAKLAYKNAGAKGKGKAFSQTIADNWQRFLDDGVMPQKFLRWHHEPQNLIDLCKYCIDDVEAEYWVSKSMPPMNAEDRRFWLLDQKINQRGVHIDIEGAKAAVAMVDGYKKHIQDKLIKLTDGVITTLGQTKLMSYWCFERGLNLPNMGKDTLEYYLRDKSMREDIRELLEYRLIAGQTSTTKYEAMIRAASEEDQRVRGVFLYSGAGTGRHAVKLVQLHNMPRGTIELKTDADMDAAFQAMACGWEEVQALYGDVMGLAASAVRGCVTSGPGKEFIVSDFKSVEARGVLWLAGDYEGLQIYIDGLDAYTVAAASIFGVHYDAVTKEQRQVGKVAILSLGFGGGIGAFASMARNYNIDLETLVPLILPGANGAEIVSADKLAKSYLEGVHKAIERKLKTGRGKASFLDLMSHDAAMACDIIKQRWRVDRPMVTQFWKDLEAAAFQAVQNPGKSYKAGAHIDFCMYGQFLLMKLPSGRCLRYFQPKLKWEENRFGTMANSLSYKRAVEGQWGRVGTYGGKLCENATQAICNDLLRHAMYNVEEAGYPVTLHVHDEPVSEVNEGYGSQEEYDKLIIDVPAWALDLPMGSEGWRGRRFRKV